MEENKEEFDVSLNENIDEGEETLKKPDSVQNEIPDEEKEKRLAAFPRIYKRMKDAEEKVKTFSAESEKTKKAQEEAEKAKAVEQTSPDEKEFQKIAEATSAFEGLDDTERSRLMKEAKLQGVSLSEAKKSQDFTFWQKSHKEKVEAEQKTPEPTFRSSTYPKKELSELGKEELKEKWGEVLREAVQKGRKKRLENI